VGKFHFDNCGNFSKVLPEKFGVFKKFDVPSIHRQPWEIPFWATKVFPANFGAFKK